MNSSENDALKMQDAEREAREGPACERANNLTEPPAELYCKGTYDTWLCWPHTPAGTVAYLNCPDFIPGFKKEQLAYKECTANGTWFRHPLSNAVWSNYTTCVSDQDSLSDVVAVYEVGYAVSLVALLLSLAILLYFKNLRCARITVHMNLFASFAANNTLWLCVYEVVMNDPLTMSKSPVWCRALNVLLQYVLVTNYMWMLCEGIYLHTVLVNAFVSERKLLRTLLALGWLFPVVPIAVYVARRVIDNDVMCWIDFDKDTLRPELAVLVLSAILLNLANLMNIVRVLWTKLRAGGALGAGAARPSATALHTLRATCLLAPLLGLQYLLLPIRPERTSRWFRTYEFASALLISLQGLCVAVLYCFCNGEVLAQLRRRWRVLTFRPRANSTTATTVSFVRSAAGAEDKV